MTVKRFVGDKITGLSSDSKPTTVNIGATFYETDTKALYIYNGSAWVQQVLTSLGDINLTSLADLDIIRYDSASGKWINRSLANPLDLRGSISVAADFPTLATVQVGWMYKILANVTDNDATKTNTGLSFYSGDYIAWSSSGTWTELGSSDLWYRSGTTIYPNTANDSLDLGSGSIIATKMKLPNSFGVVTLPTLTKNGDGTVTVGTDGVCIFNTSNDGTGTNVKLSCSTGNTLTPTDGTVNYIYADYNSGTPIYAITSTNTGFLTMMTQVPIVRVTREGTILHFEEYDEYGTQCAYKNTYKDVVLRGAERQSGLVLSTAATRVSTVSSGTAWFSIKLYSMAENKAGTSGTLYQYYLTAGVWSRSLVTEYDSDYYSDGTNRQTLNNNKWVSKYFWRDIGDDNEVYYIHGNEYNTQSDALNELVPTAPSVMTSHSLYVGKIVIQKGATNGTAYPRVWEGIVATSGVINHNDLSNIQGGTTGSYYHSDQAINTTDSPTFADVNITGLSGTGPITSTSVETSLENIDKDLVVMKEPTGFPNRTSSAWTFTDGTRKLSVTVVSGSYEIFFAGVPHTISTTKEITITDVEGIHVVYFDTDDTLKEEINPTEATMLTLIRDKCLVGIVYWDATNKSSVIYTEERHGTVMDGITHYYLHYTRGLQYYSGFALGNFVIGDGSLDSHAQFSIGEGTLADEDIGLTSSTISSTTGVPILYKYGANSYWRRTTQAGFAVKQSGTATNRLYYNQYTGGAWTLTEVGEGNYVLCHLYMYSGKTEQVFAIMGEAEYTTLPAARIGAQAEISAITLSNLPSPEMRPIATVIFQTDKDYGNSINARVVEAVSGGDDYISWLTTELPRGVTPSDHQSLSSLQLAQSGVTYGHIDDGTQTIAGSKTFSSAPTLSTMTAGSILFAGTGGLILQDNSNLFWDDTNNKLGIGTTNPPAKLSIETSGNSYGITIGETDASSGSHLLLGYFRDSDFGILQAVDENTAFRPISMNPYGGNVGIGTTSPTQKLDIYVDGASQSATRYTNSNTGTTLSDGFIVGAEAAGNGVIWSRDDTYLRFGTAAIERMRITSTGLVGIGTDSPAVKLDVSTNGNSWIRATNSDATYGSYTQLGAVSTNSKKETQLQYSTNFGLYDTAAPAFRFVIDSNGKVGIGTSSPSYKLDVRITGGIYNSLWYSSEVATTGYNVNLMQAAFTSATGYMGIGGSTASNTAFRDSFVIGTQNAYPLNFNTNDAARMTISSTGNVGINTVSPSSKLHIVSTSSGAETFPLILQNADIAAGTKVGIIFSPTSSTPTTRYAAIEGVQNDGNNLIDLAFITGTAGTITEKMRILSNGNIGIGTNSPETPLEIYNAAGNTDKEFLRLHTSGSSTGAGIQIKFTEGGVSTEVGRIYTMDTGSSSRMSFSTFGATDTLTLFNGKVGLGTTSPRDALDIRGTPATVGGAATGNLVDIVNTNTAYNSNPVSALSLWTKYKSDGTVYPMSIIQSGKENTDDANYAGYLSFITASNGGSFTERMRITSGGNVGIGTTNPLGKLHIYGSGVINPVIQSSDSESMLKIQNAMGYWKIGEPSGSTDFRFYNGLSDIMTIQSGGNVGIGTTTPYGLLELYKLITSPASPRDSAQLYIGGNPTTANDVFGWFTVDQADSGTMQMGVRKSGASYGNLAMMVDGGNVGIGTTSPFAKLHIYSSTDVFSEVQTVGTSHAAGLYLLSGDGTTSGRYSYVRAASNETTPQEWRFGMYGDKNWSIYDYTNTSARFVVNTSGNVGIGTTTPSSKLSINGGLHVGGDSDAGDNNILADGTIQGSFKSSDGTAGMTATVTFYAAASSGGAVTQLNTVTIKNGIITAWTQA